MQLSKIIFLGEYDKGFLPAFKIKNTIFVVSKGKDSANVWSFIANVLKINKL